MDKRIGLIAGNGQFPLLFARSAAAGGYEVVAIAVRQETEPELEKLVSKIHWIDIGQLQEFFRILAEEKLKKMVMAGQIKPAHIFNRNVQMDERLRQFLHQAKDKRADSLLGGIARMLERRGIRLLDSTIFLKDYLVGRGVLTKNQPSPEQWQDIHFGQAIAKHIGRLDIGQTVVIKDKAILAVEAIEGTDEAIKRGGALAGGGAVVVKVSKPRQDMRFDVPLVGSKTLDVLACASCAVLAMEAGKTLFLDKEKCLAAAQEKGICLVGI